MKLIYKTLKKELKQDKDLKELDISKDTWNSINRYYVIDGKVVWWNTFNQDIIDEKTE